MQLEPRVFWQLTVREFHLKQAAFQRAEDRQRSLIMELALYTGSFKPKDKSSLTRAKNALRRYPVKQWLRPG